MSINPLNEISRVYLNQIFESVDQDGDSDNDFADVQIARMIASGVPKEVAIRKTKNKPYNEKSKSVKEGLIGNQTKIDVAAPYGKLTSSDFKELRKAKKKVTKEGYSNWRQDLSEVISDGENEIKVKEKKVNNKIKTSAIGGGIKLGEAVENLGGTLLEISEIKDFEGVFDDLSEFQIFLLSDQLIEEVVEEFFYECLEEGYDLGEVENTLLESLEISSTLLIEERDDTEVKSDRLEKVKSAVKSVGKKIVRGAGYLGGLAVRGAKAVGRELGAGYNRGRYGASGSSSGSRSSRSSGSSRSSSGSGSSRPGLLGRIGSTLKSGLKKVIAKGARKVARGAIGVARKMEGDKKPSKAHTKTRTASTYRGAGVGQRERVSSGSHSTPKSEAPKSEPKKASAPVSDPWEGSHTTKPKKPAPKPQAKTTKVPAKTSELSAKQKAAAVRAQRRNINISPEDLQRVISNVQEDYWRSAANEYKEEYDLLEKAESEQQQKIFGLALSVKRGQTPRTEVSNRVLKIVDGMSEKEIRKFAKTKHEGLPHKVEAKEEVIRQELISRMINKIEEQSEIYVDEAKLPSSMKKGKKKVESKTQVIHDVDDNLADQRHPDAAKIDVMRKTGGSWKKVQSLTPSQFAHHKLRKPGEPVKEESDPGDKYGFDQFRSTEKFKKTTKANKPVVRLGDSPRRPAKKSVVTARGGSEFGSKKPSTPMDKPGEFAKDLKTRIGVKNLERKNVHFTGGMRSGSGPEKKGEVVKKIVKPDAKKVIATDDHLQNVRHMAAAASSVAPKAKVRAYQSKPATKAKGKVKPGDIVPVRVGKEGDLKDKNIGIRSNTSPSKSPQETQKRRKQQKMREAVDVNMQQQNTPQDNTSTSNQLTAKQKSALSRLVQSKTMELTAAKKAITSGISPDIG